jgi:tetratricopeptide (TPR) repeat protein
VELITILMSLLDTLKLKFGAKKPAANSSAGFSSESQCPHEAEVLTYSEGSLSNRRRSELERHLSSCDDCRSLLTWLAKFDATIESPAPLSEDVIRKQTARIFAFIENDEAKRSAASSAAPRRETAQKERRGFYISYPQLATAALLICAMGAAGIYWLTLSQSSEKAAMQQLASAMKEERRSATRISGGIEHSPYISTRDASASDDLPLKQALVRLSFAESETAPAEARQALARVHLAFENRDHAEKALAILERLRAGGAQSPEVLNDLGVAQFQLEIYGDAIANFNTALEQKPDYFEALFNKALAEERAGREAEARRDWRQFINSSNDPEWKAEAESHLNLLSAPPNQ